MKIRGSLNITKDLKLENTGGSFPSDGVYIRSGIDGTVYFGDLVIKEIQNKIYKEVGSLVYEPLSGNTYISIIDNASGTLPIDPFSWEEFGGGGDDIPVTSRPIGPWPAGTPLENIIEACCYPNGLSGLDISGYGSTIPENTPITDPTFTWNVTGAPTNMRLSDSVGILNNVNVTGLTSYTPTGATYSYAGGTVITWTLTADSILPITTTMTWTSTVVYDTTFFGSLPAGLPNPIGVPTESQVLGGTGVQIDTSTECIVSVGTPVVASNFFIAVPESQNYAFTNWTDLSVQPPNPSPNTGIIGTAGNWDAIEDRGTLVVSGANYRIYATGSTTDFDNSYGFRLFNP